MNSNLYVLVKWEDGDTQTKLGLIPTSNLMKNSEICHGKFVYAFFKGEIRKARIILISEDYEYLKRKLLKVAKRNNRHMATNTNTSFTPSLDSTITKLQKKLNFKMPKNSRNLDSPGPSTSYASEQSINNVQTSRPISRNSRDSESITNESERRSRSCERPSTVNRLNRSNSLPQSMRSIKTDLANYENVYVEALNTLESARKELSEIAELWNRKAQGIHENDTVKQNVNDKIDVVTSTPKSTKNNTEKKKRQKASSTSSVISDENDMVPIGIGNTKVPTHIFVQMNWQSHTIATRKLLMAIFPRKILATHSLTGKSSPAFANKPAKFCLDPIKVQDIVITVSERCNVSPSLVRCAITTKCADENKMYRVREAKKQDKKKKTTASNRENIPPQKNIETATNVDATKVQQD